MVFSFRLQNQDTLSPAPFLHTIRYTTLGIDPANYPIERRTLWAPLAGEWRLEILKNLARKVPLDQFDREIERILQEGKLTGRVVAH